ncbi:sodium/calcium exchanger NCL1-like [Lycium ferocissimum]|uniref:sodium/calcium exchanger NCL1-like n=1 Tax=Lycium ferocissimum TaxID=112874 RepID=UPI00281496E9|nr:sodium/calcium exchanger NCL1-like [Lycium ferocissimum]
MYGFLPCSKSLSGHFFLIVVYEYLLFHGEYYVAMGGERIFKILGPNSVFGASAFHILGFLPEALILLASGLLNSKEVAQEYVLTGVGLLAGSTILLLTLIWGTCVFVGSQQSTPSVTSYGHMQNHWERFLSQWTVSIIVSLLFCEDGSSGRLSERGHESKTRIKQNQNLKPAILEDEISQLTQTLKIGDIIVKEPLSKVVVNEKDDEETVNPEFID